MPTVRELHKKAMRLAQLALIARNRGEQAQAEVIACQAYQYEAKAAYSVPDGKASEPTRSILFRSAASLAYQCKEFSAAQRLIEEGLSGYPPSQIEKELRDLHTQISFEQYDGDRVNFIGLTRKRKSICVSRKHHELKLTPKPEQNITSEHNPA